MRKQGRIEKTLCCQCHKRQKASNRSYCKKCWAARARALRAEKVAKIAATTIRPVTRSRIGVYTITRQHPGTTAIDKPKKRR